jgi:hypothetical protein
MFEDMTTRRVFLQKGLTLLALAPTVPTFLDQTVMAMANPEDIARTQAQRQGRQDPRHRPALRRQRSAQHRRPLRR